VSRAYRGLAVGAPLVATATVGVGLAMGASGKARAALVYGAAPSRANAGTAWQVVVADQDHGMREGAAHVAVDVLGRSGDRASEWHGTTDGDGVAEAILALPDPARVTLEVRSAGTVLARGDGAAAPASPLPAPPSNPWAPFARREGPIALDVAVLGGRAAPSFPASVWVRARDAASGAPVAGAEVEPRDDPSLTTFTARARTDSRGWAEIVLTPAGLAIGLALDARASDGRTGSWIGGLVASPGAPRLATRSRWSPDEAVEVSVLAPPTRSTAYVEIDDAAGRAWATSVDLSATGGGATAEVRAPRLAPGLYWAVASSDPVGASTLGAGSSARPFFVARTDEEALALGPDRDTCALPHDLRETPGAIGSCLAVVVETPVGRWLALDGFAAERERDAEKRARGLAVALGGVAIAVLLEAALLLRAAAVARVAVDGALPVDRRRWTVVVALLTGLLGFALLAAFLVRLG
jgi:hypothetical protein